MGNEEDGMFFIICIVAKRSNWARGIGNNGFSLKFLWGMRSVKPMRRGPGRSGVLTSGIVENPCYAGAKSDEGESGTVFSLSFYGECGV